MLYFIEYEPTGKAEDRKTEHILGRRLLEYGLWEEYGRTYDVKQMEGGKPYLPKAPHISFNISHTKGIVVCAVSEKEIGIDVEYIREAKKAVIRRICSREETEYIFGEADRMESIKSENGKLGNMESGNIKLENTNPKEIHMRFTRIWTLKESYIKAIGKGLSFSLKEISFFLKDTKKGAVITGSIPGWNYRQFMLRGKYIVSICERE